MSNQILISYITQSQQKGNNPAAITKELLDAGWRREEVLAAIAEVNGAPQSSHPQGINIHIGGSPSLADSAGPVTGNIQAASGFQGSTGYSPFPANRRKSRLFMTGVAAFFVVITL